MIRSCLISIYFSLSLIALTCGELIPYINHVVSPLEPEYLQIPKFAKEEVPHWAPGRGHSYIELADLRFKLNCPIDASSPPSDSPPTTTCKSSTFDLLIFEEPSDKDWMDYWEEHEFCCTNDMVEARTCDTEQLGSLLIPSSLPGAFVRSITVAADTEITLHGEGAISHLEISSSGLYILLMATCEENAGTVTINGKIDSLDPYGYLPADLFGNLPFYGALSCLYSVVGITWLILCSCYR